jgi:hypothetical protein
MGKAYHILVEDWAGDCYMKTTIPLLAAVCELEDKFLGTFFLSQNIAIKKTFLHQNYLWILKLS